jgi:hypothetical protein
MRNAILILIFIVLCSNECNMPYRAKTFVNYQLVDSVNLTLANHMELTFRYSDLDWRHKTIGAAAFCYITNPTPTVQLLDRNLFSVVSSRGIQFKMTPMQVENNLKTNTVPDQYPVAPNQKEYYVFVFVSVQKYSKQQAFSLLKKDTIYFLYKRNIIADTLFGIAASDRRIQ